MPLAALHGHYCELLRRHALDHGALQAGGGRRGAAAPVGALLNGLVALPAGARVVVVLSGGNVNLDQLRSLIWN
ncbi:MAG: hypothetical protein AABO58_24850 [Acidobacteriota bacterium]